MLGEEVTEVMGEQVLKDLVGHCKTLVFTVIEVGNHRRVLKKVVT